MDESIVDEWSDADEDALVNADYPGNIYVNYKFSLKCDKFLETEGTPLQRYRPKYLTVSDLVQQFWCEQKLLYTLSPEAYLISVLPGAEVNLEESPTAKKVKEKGSGIHQARELEIQVPVEVPVITKEDVWAVKFLNILSMVQAFHHGLCVAREVPVFGMPFGSDLFLYGVIDELQYNLDLCTMEILELKTRKSSIPPKKRQQEKDKYQVGLYAHMFNELVQGLVTREMVETQLKLKLDAPLSDGVQKYIQALPKRERLQVYTVGHILDTVLCQIQTFTCITEGTIEYLHQESQKQISSIKVAYDPDMLKLIFRKQCEWWRGERGTTGVDVEDCWKCNFCQFVDFCEWRAVKAAALTRDQVMK